MECTMSKLACEIEPEIFYPEGLEGLLEKEGEIPPDYQSEESIRAKALCADCPIRDLCLQGAKDRQEPYGIWGGLDPNEIMNEVAKDALLNLR